MTATADPFAGIDLDADFTPEEVWGFVYETLLAGLPVQYGVDVAAVGRALADVHPRLLAAAAQRVAAECDRLPAPAMFRRFAAEALHGPTLGWAEALDRVAAWARWATPPFDDTAPRPACGPDEEAVARGLVGNVPLWADPTDAMRAQFRDAWAARAAALTSARVARGALAAAPAEVLALEAAT